MINGRSLEEELNRIDEFFDNLSDEELDLIIDENLGVMDEAEEYKGFCNYVSMKDADNDQIDEQAYTYEKTNVEAA